MNNSEVQSEQQKAVITPEEWLEHWQGHRRLTRKVIEAFPEKDFLSFSIGGMRPFAAIVQELLAIAGPGIKEIATGEMEEFSENREPATSKEELLKQWDEATEMIDKYWNMVPVERFHEPIKIFGQYEGTVQSSVHYFIDNEIHHRGQGYVYLRALGITPPFFWERG